MYSFFNILRSANEDPVVSFEKTFRDFSCFIDVECNAADDAQVGKKSRKRRAMRKICTEGVLETDRKRVDECIDEYCGSHFKHSAKKDALRKAVGM